MSRTTHLLLLFVYFLASAAVVLLPWRVLAGLAAFGLITGLLIALTGPGDRTRRRRLAAGHCGECGYDLTGVTGQCPECGAHFGTGWSHPADERDRARRPAPAPRTAPDDDWIPPT